MKITMPILVMSLLLSPSAYSSADNLSVTEIDNILTSNGYGVVHRINGGVASYTDSKEATVLLDADFDQAWAKEVAIRKKHHQKYLELSKISNGFDRMEAMDEYANQHGILVLSEYRDLAHQTNRHNKSAFLTEYRAKKYGLCTKGKTTFTNVENGKIKIDCRDLQQAVKGMVAGTSKPAAQPQPKVVVQEAESFAVYKACMLPQANYQKKSTQALELDCKALEASVKQGKTTTQQALTSILEPISSENRSYVLTNYQNRTGKPAPTIKFGQTQQPLKSQIDPIVVVNESAQDSQASQALPTAKPKAVKPQPVIAVATTPVLETSEENSLDDQDPIVAARALELVCRHSTKRNPSKGYNDHRDSCQALTDLVRDGDTKASEVYKQLKARARDGISIDDALDKRLVQAQGESKRDRKIFDSAYEQVVYGSMTAQQKKEASAKFAKSCKESKLTDKQCETIINSGEAHRYSTLTPEQLSATLNGSSVPEISQKSDNGNLSEEQSFAACAAIEKDVLPYESSECIAKLNQCLTKREEAAACYGAHDKKYNPNGDASKANNKKLRLELDVKKLTSRYLPKGMTREQLAQEDVRPITPAPAVNLPVAVASPVTPPVALSADGREKARRAGSSIVVTSPSIGGAPVSPVVATIPVEERQAAPADEEEEQVSVPYVDFETSRISDTSLGVLAKKVELVCEQASSEKVKTADSKEECMKDIGNDIYKINELAKDTQVKILKNHYSEYKSQKDKECKKLPSKERKECYAERDKNLKEKSNEIKRANAQFSINDRQMELISDAIDKEYKDALKKQCGKRPRAAGGSSISLNREKRAYRKCKSAFKEANLKSYEDKKLLLLAEVSTDSLQVDRVIQNCTKGAFNFISGNYEECIDEQLAQVEKEREAARLAEIERQKKAEAERARKIAQSGECTDLINMELSKILKEDSTNIIGRQFQLTALKLANQVMNNRSENNENFFSVEAMVKDQQKKLTEQDTKGISKKMLDFYKANGRSTDAAYIQEHMNSHKSPIYLSKRLNNENISAYLLADTYKNGKKSAFSEMDAAAAWMVDQMRKKRAFGDKSYEDNLMNLSVLAYRHINLVKKDKGQAKARIAEKLKAQSEKMANQFAGIRANLETKFKAQCPDFIESECWKSGTALNKMFIYNFMQIGKDVNQIEIKNDLKGSIGSNYKFDFLPDEFL